MAEPVTTGRGLVIPNTGDLPGVWGSQAVNPNMSALDAMFAGFQVISLTNANVSLSVPAGFVATAGGGPTQSQNALIRFTGVLSGNVQITFPMPGFYIVENLCTVGAFSVTLAAFAPGNVIGAPPGKKCHVFTDGINMDYVNLPDVGVYWDMAASAVPNYIAACTVPPWLNCDGSTFSAVTYPQLAALIGGTTLPDSRGRTRFTLNQTTGRITASGSFGLNGNTLLAGGGSQLLAQVQLPTVNFGVTIPAGQGSHAHIISPEATQISGTNSPISGGVDTAVAGASSTLNATLPAMSGTAASGGTAQPLVPPGYTGGITMIRAA